MKCWQRVKALLRRSTAVSDQLSFGDLHLNGSRASLQLWGPKTSTSRCANLTCSNASCAIAQQALSRTQLIQNVWGEDYFGDDNVVDVYVRYLRRKLEEVKPERIIQTIRGIGFALRVEE